MDRQIVYLGQVPRSLDVLLTNQNTMVGHAKLAEAVLGTTAVITGLGVTPTSPASMSVTVAAGQIYQQENLEASAISGLNADTHIIVKQGIALDPQTLTLTAPGTVGFSQNVLIEAQYADSDTGAIVLTYQNPNSPGQTYQGPGGNGQQQNTTRKGIVALQLKYGTAATSGTQVTPSPDAGWVGVAVVTVAYGQTTITSGNISTYSPTSQILTTLPNVPAGVQSGQWEYAVDTGVANAASIVLSPIPASLPDGMTIHVKMAAAPTGATTISVNGTPNPVLRIGAQALIGGEWNAGDVVTLIRKGSNWQISGLTIVDVTQYINRPSFLNFYVNASTGNDSNNGLTSGTAFATIQGAVNAIASTYLTSGAVTINVAAGTYAGFSISPSNIASWNIVGNTSNPSSAIVASASTSVNNGYAFSAQGRVNVSLSGFKFQSIQQNLGVSQGASIKIVGSCAFTAPSLASYPMIGCYGGALVSFNGGTHTITGTCSSFVGADAGGVVQFGYVDAAVSYSVTLSLTSASFTTAFANAADSASISFVPSVVTLTGSATGPRYFATTNGTISTAGSGASYLSGSTSGSTSLGGQYS